MLLVIINTFLTLLFFILKSLLYRDQTYKVLGIVNYAIYLMHNTVPDNYASTKVAILQPSMLLVSNNVIMLYDRPLLKEFLTTFITTYLSIEIFTFLYKILYDNNFSWETNVQKNIWNSYRNKKKSFRNFNSDRIWTKLPYGFKFR